MERVVLNAKEMKASSGVLENRVSNADDVTRHPRFLGGAAIKLKNLADFCHALARLRRLDGRRM